jgi:hypothetical protein
MIFNNQNRRRVYCNQKRRTLYDTGYTITKIGGTFTILNYQNGRSIYGIQLLTAVYI